MGAAIDAFSVAASGDAASKAWTHTPVATPRLVVTIFACSSGDPGAWVTKTYDGVVMTQVDIAGGFQKLFYYLRPPGSAQTVTLTWTTIRGIRCAAYTLIGAGTPATPVFQTNTGSSDTIVVPDTDVSGVVLEWVHHQAEASAIAPASGQTESHDDATPNDRVGIYYKQADAGSTSLQLDFGTSVTYRHVAVFIPGATAGTPRWFTLADRWRDMLRDLRAGLVPPDTLRRRYRDLVTI
jgi:hypothetical protein